MRQLIEAGVHNQDTIKTIANLNPVHAQESNSLSDVAKLMITSGHRRIPVVSKTNTLVGIVTYMDILDVLLRGLSRSTQVSDFMNREVISSEITDTIETVLQKMKISRRGGLPLTQNEKLVGIVGERDFIKIFYRKTLQSPVSEIMSEKPMYIQKNTTILNCIKTMVNTHYRRLPVIENKEVIGIVTGLDALKYIDSTNFNLPSLSENIEEIMSTPVLHVWEHNDISDAIKIIVENNIGGLPVVTERNFLKGIITERDIIEII